MLSVQDRLHVDVFVITKSWQARAASAWPHPAACSDAAQVVTPALTRGRGARSPGSRTGLGAILRPIRAVAIPSRSRRSPGPATGPALGQPADLVLTGCSRTRPDGAGQSGPQTSPAPSDTAFELGFRMGPDQAGRSCWEFESHFPSRRASAPTLERASVSRGRPLGYPPWRWPEIARLYRGCPWPRPRQGSPSKAVAGGTHVSGAAAGGLPYQPRPPTRSAAPPQAGRVWSTFGPHAIGAERFTTVSSGLQR